MTPIHGTYAGAEYLVDPTGVADAPLDGALALGACAALVAVAAGAARSLPPGRRRQAGWTVLAAVALPIGLVRCLSVSNPLGSEGLDPLLMASVWAETLGLAAALGFGIVAATAQLGPRGPSRVAWTLAALLGAAGCGVGAVARWERTAGFVDALTGSLPLPYVPDTQDPIPMHVDGTRTGPVPACAAGWRDGLLWSRAVPMPEADATAWGLDAVPLTATSPGRQVVPVEVRRGPVSVVLQVPVLGFEDRGPYVLPLAVGNRWVYELRTDQGTSSFALEVTGEAWKDGFHVFSLTGTEEGQAPQTTDVVRADGKLLYPGTPPKDLALDPSEGPCDVALLGPMHRCTCAGDRVVSCSRGGRDNSFGRALLAVLTVGLSEVFRDRSSESEPKRELILRSWRVDGVDGSADR